MSITLSKPLDDDSIPDKTFEPMPVAEYLGFVSEAEERTSSGGQDQIKLVIALKGNEKFNGKTIWYFWTDGHDHSLSMAKEMCKAFGVDITGLKKLSAEAFLGRPCKFKTKHEMYEGEMRDKISYFIEPTDADAVSAATETVTSINLDDDIIFI